MRLALALIRSAGLEDFQVNLGHVGVLAPGLAALEEPLRVAGAALDRSQGPRGAHARARRPERRCRHAGAPAVRDRPPRRAESALREAPPAALAGLQRLLALDDALSTDERRHVVYDLGEVRGLDYYTGVHFEVYVAGTGRAAGAGGRYDELMGRFGRPMPAVGLSLDLDAIAEVPQ